MRIFLSILCLALTACTGFQISKFENNNFSSSSISKSSQNLNHISFENCTKNNMYFSGKEEKNLYEKEFKKFFMHLENKSNFRFWSAERICHLDEDKKMVSFVYLAGERDINTVFALFGQKNELIKFSDIKCTILDDIAPAEIELITSDQLLIRCLTIGSGGIGSNTIHVIDEFHILNTDDFSEKLVKRKRTTESSKNTTIDELFVDKDFDKLPSEFKASMSKFDK